MHGQEVVHTIQPCGKVEDWFMKEAGRFLTLLIVTFVHTSYFRNVRSDWKVRNTELYTRRYAHWWQVPHRNVSQ